MARVRNGVVMHVLITYRVRPEHVAEHLELLEAVHEELRRSTLDGVRWTTHRREDGRSFVELVQTDRPGRFSSLATWSAFRSTLDQRCDEPPDLSVLELTADTTAGGGTPRTDGREPN